MNENREKIDRIMEFSFFSDAQVLNFGSWNLKNGVLVTIIKTWLLMT